MTITMYEETTQKQINCSVQMLCKLLKRPKQCLDFVYSSTSCTLHVHIDTHSDCSVGPQATI